MRTPYDDLRFLFERAHELREQVREGDKHSVWELNEILEAKKLGGKLVVLSVPESGASALNEDTAHSHLLPSGRLGYFAVGTYKGKDPELVVALDDIRGNDGLLRYSEIDTDSEVYDVDNEQADSKLYAYIRGLLLAPDFSFAKFAEACQNIEKDNLNLALFASGLNSTRLPGKIASAVLTMPCHVAYNINSTDVGPVEYVPVRYAVEDQDMFSFVYGKQSMLFQVWITGMIPNAPRVNYRNIVIGSNVVGYDLA